MSRNTNYIVLSFAVLNEGEEVLTSKGEQNGVTLGETKKVFSLSTFFLEMQKSSGMMPQPF